MDVGKAFTYWYKDPKWTAKLLLGALISIVPILNFAWAGYTNEIIRRVTRDDPEPLPEWGDLGRFFMQGLVLIIAGLIYALPLIVLSLLFIPVFATVDTASMDSDTAGALLSGTGLILTCCVTLYGVLLSFFLPAVQVNYSRKETFASCFAIGDIIKLVTANLGNYFIAWLAYLVFSIVISVIVSIVVTLLLIIPCIGWIIGLVIGALSAPVIGVVYGHLFGQIGAQNAVAEA
jgi:hypothetical protein